MAIRQAYLVKEQTATGVSQPKRWDMPSGTVSVEVYWDCDVGTAITALTVAIEGSISNVNYFALASHTFTSTELIAKAGMFHIVSKPTKTLKSNVISFTKTGGGEARITVMILSTDR